MSSGEDAGGEEDWEGTRREVWKTIRPDMKAGFVRPVAPGKAIDSYEEMDGWVQSLPELEVLSFFLLQVAASELSGTAC
jgi:hypothetical protein